MKQKCQKCRTSYKRVHLCSEDVKQEKETEMNQERIKELLEIAVMRLFIDNDWRRIKDEAEDISQEELDFLYNYEDDLDRLCEVIDGVVSALIECQSRLMKQVN